MKLKCPGCGVELGIENPKTGCSLACPKCSHRFRIPAGAKEYKVLTQKMLCGGDSSFDAVTVERILNAYAVEGWRVVSAPTYARPTIGFSDAIYPMVIVLERDLPEG